MNKYLRTDPWKIIEEGFDPSNHKRSESIFSLGNGRMGQRANFEEYYSGESLQGNYYAGIYYPDKTRVGWWKNGYPEYFAKILNGTNWIGINIVLNTEELDLAKCQIEFFSRELDMRTGILKREFIARLESGKRVKVYTERFISMTLLDLGVISYEITPLNFEGTITFRPYLDGDVVNEDSNYDEKFWQEVSKSHRNDQAYLCIKTKKLDFHLGSLMQNIFTCNDKPVHPGAVFKQSEKFISAIYTINVSQNDSLKIVKYVANVSSFNYPKEKLADKANEVLKIALDEGFENLKSAHADWWKNKWQTSDIQIEGDEEAQQGIRFNIFQLYQTYTGVDARLNIGPKGFTGEKYGGTTYWDTEAYAFSFYMNTASADVAKNLLLYRYKHLEKAIDNAKKLGIVNGAALYPMVTINGEECHNEWEITFEEIHRNGAIAFAIYNYYRHTGDFDYMVNYGLEVLAALSRFWAERVNYSLYRQKYVILGVTGPNEYENNVNNNWYTNRIAQWTLDFTMKMAQKVKEENIEAYNKLLKKIKFDEEREFHNWLDIRDNMYLPVIEGSNIFLQNDGFLDKAALTVDDIPSAERPINQHWSWDRILRSPFIKQADVLQGIYFLEEEFTDSEIKENFYFYEKYTVHESSLSACVHSIVAAKIGDIEKAYALYLRTARLDLDDYNHEVHEGLHITSMAGTWLSIVEGFGGKRIKNGVLSFAPQIPEHWKNYSFKIQHKDAVIVVIVDHQKVQVFNHSNVNTEFLLYNNIYRLGKNSTLEVEIPRYELKR